jgi:hypothetical protein
MQLFVWSDECVHWETIKLCPADPVINTGGPTHKSSARHAVCQFMTRARDLISDSSCQFHSSCMHAWRSWSVRPSSMHEPFFEPKASKFWRPSVTSETTHMEPNAAIHLMTHSKHLSLDLNQSSHAWGLTCTVIWHMPIISLVKTKRTRTRGINQNLSTYVRMHSRWSVELLPNAAPADTFASLLTTAGPRKRRFKRLLAYYTASATCVHGFLSCCLLIPRQN